MSALCEGYGETQPKESRLPIFRLSRVLEAVRGENGSEEAEQADALRRETKRRISELRQQIKRTKRELLQLRPEPGPGNDKERRARFKRTKKMKQQEIFPLKRELRAAKQLRRELRARKRRTEAPWDPTLPKAPPKVETGALPDFLVIGEKKCGTTYFYDLLTRHPYVEPAASKELHYFDAHFEEGTDWYRRCFPAPRWIGGRRTITGEATPVHDLDAPERMAGVVPDARLISLLRNPVDRAYSDYQQVRAREGNRPFEEAVGERAPAGYLRGASTWTTSCAGRGSSPESRCSC